MPADDESLELSDYADAVIASVGERKQLVVVGQSFGAFTATLVASRLPVDALVFVAGVVPLAGETPGEWWTNTGFPKPSSDDPYVCFYNGVPRQLAAEAISRQRKHPSKASNTTPLEPLPEVPTRFVLCTEDHFFPPAFLRRVVSERLGVKPDEIAAGHCVALSQPKALADILERFAVDARKPRVRLADHYDVEPRRLNQRLREATSIKSTDHVLDIGCGAGRRPEMPPAPRRLAACLEWIRHGRCSSEQMTKGSKT